MLLIGLVLAFLWIFNRKQVGYKYQQQQDQLIDIAQLYSKAHRSVHDIMDRIGHEWFISDGNLIAALRYGSPHSKIGEHDLVLVDSDIDIMIRCDDVHSWNNEVIPALCKQFLSDEWRDGGGHNRLWKTYTIYSLSKSKLDSNKITFYTDINVIDTSCRDYHEYDLHVDIHRYFLNSDGTTISVIDLSDGPDYEEYPFGMWGGRAPYAGFIVDPNTHSLKTALMDGRPVPVPFDTINYVQTIRNRRYHSEEQPCHFPVSAMWSTDDDVVECTNGRTPLTQNDSALLAMYSRALRKSGYESFDKLFPLNEASLLPTVVSCYFPLKSKKLNSSLQLPSKFSNEEDFYLSCGREVLQYRGPIVFYTTPRYGEFVKKHRGSIPTQIIYTTIEELNPSNATVPQNIMETLHSLKNADHCVNWLQHGVELEKLMRIYFARPWMVQHALPFFDSDWYIWLDFAYFRDGRRMPRIWPSLEKIHALPKNKATFFAQNTKDKCYRLSATDVTVCRPGYSVDNDAAMKLRQPRIMCNFFVAHRQTIPEFTLKYGEFLKKLTDNKILFGCDDEDLMDHWYCSNLGVVNTIQAYESYNSLYWYSIEYFKV